MARGRLITIEGIDGAGKTTLAAALAGRAARRAASTSSCCASPAACAPPSGSASWSTTRTARSAPRAEALLYAAARAQLVEEALGRCSPPGTWVLLDRFVDSSLAYQGGGRELGIDAVRDDQRVRDRRPRARPDAAAAHRPAARALALAARGEAPPTASSASPTTSSRGSPRAYDELAAAEPERIRRDRRRRSRRSAVLADGARALADLLERI